MDYSLFLIIEKKAKLTKKEMKEKHKNPHKFVSKDGKYIYHIAIIDYLQ